MENSVADYWLRLEVLLCALVFVMPTVIAVGLLQRRRGGGNPVDLWAPCRRNLHPRWLLYYRAFAFVAMAYFLYQTVVAFRFFVFFFYTQLLLWFQFEDVELTLRSQFMPRKRINFSRKSTKVTKLIVLMRRSLDFWRSVADYLSDICRLAFRFRAISSSSVEVNAFKQKLISIEDEALVTKLKEALADVEDKSEIIPREQGMIVVESLLTMLCDTTSIAEFELKVGYFRRSRTIKGKKGPPSCNEISVNNGD